MTIARSTIFLVWFVVMTAVLAILFLPTLVLSRRGAALLGYTWSAAVLWGLGVFAGTRFEVRGRIPPSGVLVAVKHMSMWDTMAVYYLLDDPAIVLKHNLLYVPFYGWYLWKAGMIAIDRDGKASALRAMAAASRKEIERGRSIAIFPEGTRKKPGAAPDYKPGVAGLYGQLDVPCYPAALNSGLFWTGWMGFIKRRGTIVIEFLDPIPPGLPRREFMPRLEAAIESATSKLVAEGRKQLEN